MIKIETRPMIANTATIVGWLTGQSANAARIAALGISIPEDGDNDGVAGAEVHVLNAASGRESRLGGPDGWTANVRFAGARFVPIASVQAFETGERRIVMAETPVALGERLEGAKLLDGVTAMLDATQEKFRLRDLFGAVPRPNPAACGPQACWAKNRDGNWRTMSPRPNDFQFVRILPVGQGRVVGIGGRGVFVASAQNLARYGQIERGEWESKWTAPAAITSVSRATENRLQLTAAGNLFTIDFGDRDTSPAKVIDRTPFRGFIIGRTAGEHQGSRGICCVEPGANSAQVTYYAAGVPLELQGRSQLLAKGEPLATPDAARTAGAI